MVNPWGPPAGGAGGPAPEPNCGFGGTGKGGEEKMGGAAGGKSESTKTHQDQDESGDFCRLPALQSNNSGVEMLPANGPG